MGFIGKSVLLTLIALCCFISSVFSTTALPPMKLITPLPTLPPTKAPIKLPTLPPTKAPIKLPTLPPAKAPIKLPTLPPTKAPIKPPVVLPPVSPPKFNRTLVAVRGVVFCKACKYAGINNLQGAKPVKGAVVRLLCKNKKNATSEATTDKNGYFLLYAPKTVTNYAIKNCRAYLVKSPDAKCSKVSTLHGGYLGAFLKPVVKPENATIIFNKLKYALFNVGPFAFEPVCPK
ncbi:Non-classical arabinogalactan protein 30 [Hirschfeldia incana]|nr:Non-classical arabinogalactan protein 30 [Hirschfeldia incana]